MATDIFWQFAPEVLLVVVAGMLSAARSLSVAHKHATWIAAAAIVVASVLLAITGSVGPSLSDGLAAVGRPFALVVGLGLVLMTNQRQGKSNLGYLGLLLLTIVGFMLVASAQNLWMLFVGLELVVFPAYIMLLLDCRDERLLETVAKRFFLGGLASALFLYGLSFLYGMAGSTDLTIIRAKLTDSQPATTGALSGIALILIVIGLGYRVAAVPFHFRIPDILQDTSHVNAALLSVMPKAAGFFVLIRLLLGVMPCMAADACRLVMLLAVLSMTAAHVMAFRQDRLRRLLAYSTIAYTGYFFIALSTALAGGGGPMCWDPTAAMLFSLVVYALAMLGTFAALAHLGQAEKPVDHVDELAGLARTHPVIAATLAVLLLSLSGVAPLAGFWGLLAIFGGTLEVAVGLSGIKGIPGVWFIVLAVVGAVNAAVAAAYYIRVVGVIYFRLPLGTLRPEGGRSARAVAVVCALAIVGIGICGGPLWHWTREASRCVTIESLSVESEIPIRNTNEGI